jgi:hypothetical protein
VLFAINLKVDYGQSVSLVGAGQELGDWKPENSFHLAWNEGDVWGAELELPAGLHEYKYVVRHSDGRVEVWQPGENCSVEVPSDHVDRVVVTDDWLGKSRSVLLQPEDASTAASADKTASSSTSGSDATTAELEQKTVPELKDDLREQGLPVSGRKDELVQRLVETESEAADLEQKTVPELKDDLREQGLPVSGRKDELVERLVESGPESASTASNSKAANSTDSSSSSVADESGNSSSSASTKGAADSIGAYGSRDALEEKTLPELKEELKQQGLPVSGNKAELIERLTLGSEDEDTPSNGNLQSMSVEQLRAELKARGLPVSGKKKELVQRLRKAGHSE